jgi:dTMP kinase
MSKSIFISVEGIDGSGKSTLAQAIDERLRLKGYKSFYTEEPTKTKIGDIVRKIVIDKIGGPIEPLSQALFFAADRAIHVDKVIEPKLDAGYNVVCDRYIDSSLAYQGISHEISFKIVELNKLIAGNIRPDITFLLDLPVDKALLRINEDVRDNFEVIDFLSTVQERYLALAYKEKQRIIILDGLKNKEELLDIAFEKILKRIREKLISIAKESDI